MMNLVDKIDNTEVQTDGVPTGNYGLRIVKEELVPIVYDPRYAVSPQGATSIMYGTVTESTKGGETEEPEIVEESAPKVEEESKTP